MNKSQGELMLVASGLRDMYQMSCVTHPTKNSKEKFYNEYLPSLMNRLDTAIKQVEESTKNGESQ